MKNIILLEPVIAHYRKDVYNFIQNNGEYNIEIIGGKKYLGIKTIQRNYKLFDFFSFNLLGHRFYYLKGSIRYILKKKPDLIICGGFDPHLLHTTILFIIWKLLKSKPFIWWTHGTFGNQGKIGYFFRKLFYKNSNGALLYNTKGKENLIKMGLSQKKLFVIKNALNKEDYGFLNVPIKKNNAQKPFTIIYSGRLTTAKKIDVLLDALALLKRNKSLDFKCYIIGNDANDFYKNKCSELNLRNEIIFVGGKYGKDVHQYFEESDLFVYPGGIGLSIVHAMSFGLPVLTTDNISLHFPEFELLEKGYNGDLYKDSSPKDMASKIIEWSTILTEKKTIFAENCIESIKRNGYLPDKVGNSILEFLNSLN